MYYRRRFDRTRRLAVLERCGCARAGQRVVSFEHELLSRVDVGFYTMWFAALRARQHVLQYYTPAALDDGTAVLNDVNAGALCAKLGIQHASPLQLVCFFSVLAAAAMPWHSANPTLAAPKVAGCSPATSATNSACPKTKLVYQHVDGHGLAQCRLLPSSSSTRTRIRAGGRARSS